jgi:hypothetical protein
MFFSRLKLNHFFSFGAIQTQAIKITEIIGSIINTVKAILQGNVSKLLPSLWRLMDED